MRCDWLSILELLDWLLEVNYGALDIVVVVYLLLRDEIVKELIGYSFVLVWTWYVEKLLIELPVFFDNPMPYLYCLLDI